MPYRVMGITCYNHYMDPKTFDMAPRHTGRTSRETVDSFTGDPDELLLPSTAARELGYSTSTIRVWTDSGRLPVTRLVGGTRVIRRRDLAAFAAARRR